MQNKGLWMGFGVLLVAAAVAIFMAGQGFKAPQKAASQPSANTASPTTVASTESGTTAMQEIDVTADEYSFTPSSINLKAGDEVKITFKNAGRLPHNLVIDELKASSRTIGGGQEDTITVKADKTGTYTFYCSVGNHRQLGMEGTVFVK